MDNATWNWGMEAHARGLTTEFWECFKAGMDTDAIVEKLGLNTTFLPMLCYSDAVN